MEFKKDKNAHSNEANESSHIKNVNDHRNEKNESSYKKDDSSISNHDKKTSHTNGEHHTGSRLEERESFAEKNTVDKFKNCHCDDKNCNDKECRKDDHCKPCW